MIKARYVATVEIDFTIEDKSKIQRPISDVRDDLLYGRMSRDLHEAVMDAFFDDNFPGTVTVTQQYADLVEVNADDEKF